MNQTSIAHPRPLTALMDTELPFTLRRLQFPVRPAWVISINKSQSQTVSGRFGIYLPTPVFAHGQLYVALSRATESGNVRVLGESYEDHQRKLPLSVGVDSAALFTLNLVDQTLLSDEGRPCISPMGTLTASRGYDVTGPGVETSGSGVGCERHRLATVSPDPLSLPAASRSSLSWSSERVGSHPFMADEWAHTEVGMPCTCSGSVATQPLLEERGPEDLECESEAESEDRTEV